MSKRTFALLLTFSSAWLLAGCSSNPSTAAAMQPALPAQAVSKVFKITDYGAKDNPAVSSSDAFTLAIADCKKAGGGTVEVPAGHYLTGPIDMVDNMTLQVDDGAVVLFDPDRAKYPDVLSRWEGLTEMGPHPLLFANGLHHIAITGNGTFDGQGATWWANMDPAERGNARPDRPIKRRPPLVQIKECDEVRIDGPTFQNSPFWNIHLLYSTHIDVGHVRLINPPTSPNTDALQTDSCSHVIVHDSFADVGDDGFGIKSGRDEEGRKDNRPTTDVLYVRLHVAHAHSVCAIGSEQSGGVNDVHFIDCDGDGTDNGIRIKSARGRGGVVENVTASNITLNNIRTAAIILTMRYTQTPVEEFSERTPIFRNIQMDHITVTNSTTCLAIQGLEEHPIENISFSDLKLSGNTGVVCSYAKDITFSNVTVSAQKPYSEDHSENIQKTGWREVLTAPPAQ